LENRDSSADASEWYYDIAFKAREVSVSGTTKNG